MIYNCQIFKNLKRCARASKNAASVFQKREMVEDPCRIERHQLKLGLNPHVSAHSVLGGGQGVERDSPRTLSLCHLRTPSHSISNPLAPSRSLFLSLLLPVTLNPEVAWGGGDPLFEGRGRQ